MHIPDKYREHYDRLARSHPWMREMRDEPCTFQAEKVQGSGELPKGDAVAILRKVAADKTDVSSDDLLRYAVGADMVPDALDTLADMVERDYVRREHYYNRVRELAIERDKWKAKANCVHDYEEGVCDGNPFIKKWTCRKCGHETLLDGKAEGSSKVRAGSSSAKRAAAVERLRDYENWSNRFYDTSLTKAVIGVESCGCTWQENRDALIDLLTDDDGVARSNDGVTNIEWYAKNDLRKLCDLGIDGNMSCNDCPNQCVETEEGTPPEECQRRLLEWLLSPHVDDCGQNTDMSEKGVDCVCSDGEMSENNAHSNVTQEDGASLSELSWNLSDSRENLESDLLALIEKWRCYDGNYVFVYGSVMYAQIKELLDRQAAIIERELCAQCEWPSVAAQPDTEAYDRIDELTAERDSLAEELSKAQELCAARGKTIESLERFVADRKEKFKDQIVQKTEYCKTLKADRDQYRKLYEAAMSTDYAQVTRERDGLRDQIKQIRSIITDETPDD